MKNFKALLLSLALVCLLAPAALGGDGTIGTGADRTSPTPTPPPASQETAEAEASPSADPDACTEADLAELIQEALTWIGAWATML